MSGTHIRFDDDDYETSNSEDEYNIHEKQLLEKARNRQNSVSESENEVFGVHSDTSSDIALSDVEGQDEEDGLPDTRAWGKDKRQFYATDYVDPDYGGYQGKDAVLADLEEEEAKNLQKQLIEQLDDEDFSLDIFNKVTQVHDKTQTEEIVKTDVSKLSKRLKIDLLNKESPEFLGLVDDFKCKMKIVQEFLYPAICMFNEGQIRDCEALEFVKTYFKIIINYCVNINMYLLLKISHTNVQNHPIIKRLYQYRQMLTTMDPIFESTIKPQLQVLIDTNLEIQKTTTTKNLLKVLKNSLKTQPAKTIDMLQLPKKKSKASDLNNLGSLANGSSMPDNLVNTQENDLEINKDDTTDSRRTITYQIAKNKGLTPHRNKLQKNPRVKHRNKYRKAKIRRKGAVREVRTETSRYAGEISGIKASVSKSIKIKS